MIYTFDVVKDMEAKGLVTKAQYGYYKVVPSLEFQKGDYVVVTEGEGAGSVGYISYISTTRVTFTEDETRTGYEIPEGCSITFMNKVGDPKTYGYKFDKGGVKKISLKIGDKSFSNAYEVDKLLAEACMEAVSDMEFDSPYNFAIKGNVEILQEVSA